MSDQNPAHEKQQPSFPPNSSQIGQTLFSSSGLRNKTADTGQGGIENDIKAVDWDANNDKPISEIPYNTENAIEVLDWDGPNDPTNPYNFRNTRKWIITATALLGTFIILMNGTSITAAAHEINAEFGVSDASFPNSYWPVASWGVGSAIFVIIGLPLMEDHGVRRGYLTSYALFLLMIIPQALAKNFATLVATRFFSGGLGTLPANIVASIVPDLWQDGKGRSLPAALFVLFYVLGITVAPPIFAGVMEKTGNWRWIFYIQLIMYGAFFPLLALLLKETRGAVILRRRAEKLRKETGKPIYAPAELNAPTLGQILRKSTYRPIYLLCTEPVLASMTLWSAFSFGNVFLFTQSTAQVFTTLYGWQSYSCGYVQISVAIGEILGWAASCYGTQMWLKSADRNEEKPGHPIPEARLYVSIFGSFFGITGGMLVYGWSSYPFVHWIVPTLGLTMVGFGIQTVTSAVVDYVEDAYAASDYAASAISAVSAVENIFAGLLPLASSRMYTELGFHWASSLLGIMALVMSFAPLLFVWKGKWFRKRSPFMSSDGKSAPNIVISSRANRSTNRDELA